MPFLHKLALTFFLQDKAIDLQHITKQEMNYCCLLDVEWLSLGLHPAILIDVQVPDIGK